MEEANKVSKHIVAADLKALGKFNDVGAWSETVNDALQEALEEDELENEAVCATQGLVNMLGGTLNLDESPEDEHPSMEEMELGEEDVLNVPIVNLRWALMTHLMEPIVEQKQFESSRVTAEQISNGMHPGYLCAKCGHIAASFSTMKKHKARMHSAWFELMASFRSKERESSDKFDCPEEDFSTHRASSMREHLLNDCKEKAIYIQMEEEDEVGRAAYATSRVKVDEDGEPSTGKRKRNPNSAEIEPAKNKKVVRRKGKPHDPVEEAAFSDDARPSKGKGKERALLISYSPTTRRLLSPQYQTRARAIPGVATSSSTTLDEEEEDILEVEWISETITHRELKQKLGTKKPLPTFINLLRALYEELKTADVTSLNLTANTLELDSFELLTFEDCLTIPTGNLGRPSVSEREVEEDETMTL